MLPDVSPETFASFQALIYAEAGIWLAPHKTALLASRLAKRMHLRGADNLHKYYKIVRGDEQERTVMLDCITTNETHFFREPRHFEFLVEKVFPQWKESSRNGKKEKIVRVWSAGCSTGQEPYSLAMLLLKHLPGWHLEILGTDISTRVLQRAQTGIYEATRQREIPDDYLHSFMLRGTGEQEGNIKVMPEVRKLVRFQWLNLNANVYPKTSFDLIFCRNVLIYFNRESKAKVIQKMLRQLSPQGLLFLGHSENLSGLATGASYVAPAVYRVAP